MTNDLGHQIARSVGDVETLGAYRRGNRISWVPGALIDMWIPCARGEASTGVEGPHVYFVQTIGDRSVESGSIYCSVCRDELAGRRGAVAVKPSPAAVAPVPQVPQGALPF